VSDHVGVSLFLHLVKKLLCFCIQSKCIFVLVFSVGASLFTFFSKDPCFGSVYAYAQCSCAVV